MAAFADFRRAVDDRHGVGDVELARAHGLSPKHFYRVTRREEWEAPLPRVRLAPDSTPSVQRDLLTVCGATGYLAAASGLTAAWLHGLRERPPARTTFVVGHGTQIPVLKRTAGRAARWLTADDIVEVDGIPTLAGPAMLVSVAQLDRSQVRSLLIDATFGGLCDPDDVLTRLEGIGPVDGRGELRAAAVDLAGRVVESVFQDEVLDELDRLGYRPSRSATRIETPDGIGLTCDIPLAQWMVAVEPEGDAFHRTREQRRTDRRRVAAYAGTRWAPVPVDWRDWHRDRDHVLASIDAAIEQQRQLGIGADLAPPRR